MGGGLPLFSFFSKHCAGGAKPSALWNKRWRWSSCISIAEDNGIPGHILRCKATKPGWNRGWSPVFLELSVGIWVPERPDDGASSWQYLSSVSSSSASLLLVLSPLVFFVYLYSSSVLCLLAIFLSCRHLPILPLGLLFFLTLRLQSLCLSLKWCFELDFKKKILVQQPKKRLQFQTTTTMHLRDLAHYSGWKWPTTRAGCKHVSK